MGPIIEGNAKTFVGPILLSDSSPHFVGIVEQVRVVAHQVSK